MIGTELFGTISIDVYYSAWIGIACAAHWAWCEALGVVEALRVLDNRIIGPSSSDISISVRFRNEKAHFTTYFSLRNEANNN